jgi:uncharacterized protein (TIGR00269 family)
MRRDSHAMKCKRCAAKAAVHLPHHNAAFCRDCFILYFRRQVQRTIERDRMFSAGDRVLVAVSGGKDSLALWEVLVGLGYQTVGLHLALGIGAYSQQSTEKTRAFADRHGLRLLTVELHEEALPVPTLARFTNRPPCSACGTAKRHYFDRIAYEQGFDVLATGHNLDDEAARLMGNVMRWQVDHLGKQQPVLSARHERFVRKVKPLYRVPEYETAVYAFLSGIDYLIEECPNSAGASQLVYKDALNRIEAAMPGSKLTFVQEFLKNGQPAFAGATAIPPETCESCGMPAFGRVCAYCRLVEEVRRKQSRQPAAGATGDHG